MKDERTAAGYIGLGVALGLSVCLTGAALTAQTTLETLPDEVADMARCDNVLPDPTLTAWAVELAAGVTGARELEIAALLPDGWTARVLARAQDDGVRLTVPRMLRTSYSRFGEVTSIDPLGGPAPRRRKAACSVGVHVAMDTPEMSIADVVVLWRRDR